MRAMTMLDTTPRTAEIEVLDPATGEALGAIPAGSSQAADDAVRAARAAQPAWARTPAAERAGHLKAAARRLREHAQELAELQTREGGKPLADSLGGVEAGIGAIEQYAELGPLHRGRSLQGGWDAADLMVHEPRGVIALLVPWNDPVAIACGQIAAALVAGNAVVYKPSEKTPLSGARLVELLDVGGKDALIVDAGVDPEWAAGQAAEGAFANAGQICTSVERIYVHADVAGPFLDALVRRAEALRVGPGLDPETDMGPLIDAE